MKIVKALFIPGNAAFYFDDQQAIKQGAIKDGFFYQGAALTTGFSAIRQAGESISIVLLLENGQVAIGDCVAVQYSGAGGRDPLFTCQAFIPFLEQHIRPLLEGLDVSSFLNHSKHFDSLIIEGQRLHTAIRYGLSQALLDASALANHCLKAEIICQEYNLPIIPQAIPLFGQSGDERYTAVDKMILKQVDALPHALINNVEEKLGHKGEKLKAYIEWLVQRISRLRQSEHYQPDLHIDVYGTIGIIFDHDPVKIADYIAQLQALAEPFNLYIEGPVDAGNREAQIESLAAITSQLKQCGSKAKIVADEWCNTYEDIIAFTDAHCCDMAQIKTPDLGAIHNTVEATLYCKQHQVGAYQGGTCNETDISARHCVHIALAVRPERMLAKPGMGFDEGMTIVNNEMQRSVAVLEYKLKHTSRIESSNSEKLSEAL